MIQPVYKMEYHIAIKVDYREISEFVIRKSLYSNVKKD